MNGGMSAIGTKQTSLAAPHMSAFGVKRTSRLQAAHSLLRFPRFKSTAPPERHGIHVSCGSRANKAGVYSASLSEPRPLPNQDKRRHCITARAPTGGTIVGAASMYDPFQPGYDEGGIETASGEIYDSIAWTGAIQIDLRETFGGIRHGKDYRPAYALVEAAGKKAIIKINDVGPLKPGRVIDFNENTMRYFDPSLQLEIVHSVKITPLPGDDWAPGPVNR